MNKAQFTDHITSGGDKPITLILMQAYFFVDRGEVFLQQVNGTWGYMDSFSTIPGC